MKSIFGWFFIIFGSCLFARSEVLTEYDSCFDDAAELYNINSTLLKSIAQVESSMNPQAINFNNEHSVDYGLMQVNTFWLPLIKEFGISKDDLFDPCTSIFVGAWILADNIARYGETWESVGVYNAGTSKTVAANARRAVYSSKVYEQYFLLLNAPK